jgi:alanyl-tRNA synthetase
VTVAQGKRSVYETDLFQPTLSAIRERSKQTDERASRIIADHLRASVFLVGDGALPSNTDQGYIVRRLLRRSIRLSDRLQMPQGTLSEIAAVLIDQYQIPYPVLGEKREQIISVILEEETKFRRTLEKGLRLLEKRLADGVLSGKDAFELFSTYGFPLEMTKEIALERGMTIDERSYQAELEKHQALSRSAAQGKFKGGLADHSEKVTAFHTATHLMLAALRQELGPDVHQAGSNITEERTRFDFTYPSKVDRDVLDRVEKYVNEAIEAGAQVKTTVMPKSAAQAAGVEGSFWEKYPDQVTVYQVEGPDGRVYSQELCGGPHVENTRSIGAFGRFRIAKEEASSAGVRRVKGIFEAS